MQKRKNPGKRQNAAKIVIFIPVAVCVIVLCLILSGGENSRKNNSGEFAPDDSLSASDEAEKVILIDPGHGGSDPGCTYGNANESDINLKIAMKVKKMLTALGYNVLLTREDDSFVSLSDRIDFINGFKACILVSIHQNALENDTETEGIETWYNPKKNKTNGELAKYIQNNVQAACGAKDRELKSDTGLAILKNTEAPACLVETGFLSCPEEREKLLSGEYQDKIAAGIVRGIDEYCVKYSYKNDSPGPDEASVPDESESIEPPDITPEKPNVREPENTAEDKVVALTFDDGPHPVNTYEILDCLSENGAVATFFMPGSRVEEYPDIVKLIYERGNEAASHGYSHKELTKMSFEKAEKELKDTSDAIEAACGKAPVLVRPPYGSMNKKLAERLGVQMVLWSVDPEDWKDRDAQIVAERVIANVQDNSIVLMHDLYKSSADALSVILPELKKQGYKFVTVSQLIERRLSEGKEIGIIFP